MKSRRDFLAGLSGIGVAAAFRGDAIARAAGAGRDAAQTPPHELAREEDLRGWDGLGLAVQAYGKRAEPVLAWLAELARSAGRRLPVRLVKGAYWDTEIKRAQERGLDGFPVFTRKIATDVSYLACAKRLFAAGRALYPQFASHNAHTLAAIVELVLPAVESCPQRCHHRAGR